MGCRFCEGGPSDIVQLDPNKEQDIDLDIRCEHMEASNCTKYSGEMVGELEVRWKDGK